MKRSPSTARRDFATIFLPGLTLFMLLVLWELGVKVSKVEAWILPGPSQIVTSLWQVRELLWQHGVQTIYETFLGFSLAIIVGIALATVIDWSETLRKAIYPLLIISQTIPIIAVAPLLIIWFGYGLLPKILVMALVCFFPITIT